VATASSRLILPVRLPVVLLQVPVAIRRVRKASRTGKIVDDVVDAGVDAGPMAPVKIIIQAIMRSPRPSLDHLRDDTINRKDKYTASKPRAAAIVGHLRTIDVRSTAAAAVAEMVELTPNREPTRIVVRIGIGARNANAVQRL